MTLEQRQEEENKGYCDKKISKNEIYPKFRTWIFLRVLDWNKIFMSIGSGEATRARIISEIINYEKFSFFTLYQENRAEKTVYSKKNDDSQNYY